MRRSRVRIPSTSPTIGRNYVVYKIIISAYYNPIVFGQAVLVKEIDHDNRQEIIDFIISKGYALTDILSIEEIIPITFNEFVDKLPSIEEFSDKHKNSVD